MPLLREVAKMSVPVLILILAHFCLETGAVFVRSLPPDRRLADQIVDTHNRYRRTENAANMRHMKWYNYLARSAQRHADECQFIHSRAVDRNYAGENLLATYDYDTNITWWWWSEVYKCPCSQPPTFNMCCGHYSQLAWADTYAIGCGITECTHLLVENGGRREWSDYRYSIVCHYAPRGNVMYYNSVNSRPAYIYGAQCSRCPKDTVCYEGLCYGGYE